MTISKRLFELLKDRRIMQKDFAVQIGVTASTLNTWFARGEDFPARYISPICDALQISPSYLLDGIETPLPKIPDDYVQLTEDERFIVDTLRSLDKEGVIVVTNKAIEEARRSRAMQGNTAGNRVG